MIKMVAGVYGLTVKRADGSTYVKGMGPKSGPFTLSPEKEAALVAMGAAQYVESQKTADNEKRTLEGMPLKQLREIGKEHGLTFKFGATKAEMAEAIIAAQSNIDGGKGAEPDSVESADAQTNPAEDEVTEENPETESEEDAPTFDAAEAVK